LHADAFTSLVSCIVIVTIYHTIFHFNYSLLFPCFLNKTNNNCPTGHKYDEGLLIYNDCEKNDGGFRVPVKSSEQVQLTDEDLFSDTRKNEMMMKVIAIK
jgi:hypothetical protein